jgi:signal transduction histidine kinase
LGRVVLIDDEPRLAGTLRRFLEGAGHEVRTAGRFSEIEHDLRPGCFDVLVTDVVLPELTGVEIVGILVDRGCLEPMVLMTGDPNVDSAAEAIRLGAFDYLTKPVTKVQLIAVVARAMRHAQLVRERDRACTSEAAMLRRLAAIAERADALGRALHDPRRRLEAELCQCGLPASTSGALPELLRALSELDSLLGETLTYARPMLATPEPTDVTAVVREVIDVFRRHSPREPVVALHAPAERLCGEIDRRLVRQLVLHLLTNAAQARGARVSVSLAGGPDAAIVLTIEDDGPGIPDELATRLFVPFTTTKPGAAGLGLAMCRKIAEAHGGSISYLRGAAGGARIVVELPAVARIA